MRLLRHGGNGHNNGRVGNTMTSPTHKPKDNLMRRSLIIAVTTLAAVLAPHAAWAADSWTR